VRVGEARRSAVGVSGRRVSRHPSRPGALLRYAVGAATLAALILGTGALATGEGYRDAVLADGAVGYWRLGEAIGTTAADATASATRVRT
jgi:hypothetical protein